MTNGTIRANAGPSDTTTTMTSSRTKSGAKEGKLTLIAPTRPSMLAQQASTLYATDKYASSRSEPGRIKDRARRLCVQKVRHGSTRARNL